MAAVVDICNLALAHLGHSAKVTAIEPPDASVEAMHCARFYPQARDQVLSKHDWAFASRRATLAELSVDEDLYSDFRYAYALPDGYLRLIGVIDVNERALPMSAQDFDYQVEALSDGTQILLCDLPPEVMNVRYVYRETNAARYPATFVNALSFELASMLAGPIRKGGQRQEMIQAAAAALLIAAGIDSNVDNARRRRREAHQPPWIANR